MSVVVEVVVVVVVEVEVAVGGVGGAGLGPSHAARPFTERVPSQSVAGQL